MMHHVYVLALAFLLLACGKVTERCSTCGMTIDPSTAFRAELIKDGKTSSFDTSVCALTAYKKDGGAIFVQEFYSRKRVDGATVRFVKGSDVVGPMGADLVPVDASLVEKFEHDHGGTRTYALAEIDDGALRP